MLQIPEAPHTLSIPELYTEADPSLIAYITSVLFQRLTQHNDKIPLSSTSVTRFHSRAPPSISILDYLKRIIKYAAIEPICLLVLVIYADRISEKKKFCVSSLTVHRFIITAITVACKTLCDIYLANSTYAKVGGISTNELNVLELEFLFLADFRLTVSTELIQQYYVNLVNQCCLTYSKNSSSSGESNNGSSSEDDTNSNSSQSIQPPTKYAQPWTKSDNNRIRNGKNAEILGPSTPPASYGFLRDQHHEMTTSC